MAPYTGGGGYLPLTWWLGGASIDLWFTQGKYFDSSIGDGQPVTNYISISRASTAYAPTSSGILSSFANNILRITSRGLMIEDTSTNVVLWCRDLTNAAWTKANVTATLNQTGADGLPNSATSLTATSANGTVLQTITLASSQRVQSAYVKRLSGSGTINMTTDGGTTWVVISPTTDYTQLTIPVQTVTNPQVGFRIVTSGDSIAVDFVQNETNFSGGNSSSPILTTTASATRASDLLQAQGGLDTIIQTYPMSVVLDFLAIYIPTTSYRLVAYGAGLAPLHEKNGDTSGISSYDGSVTLSAVLGSSQITTNGVKVGASFGGLGGRSLVGGGGAVVSDLGGATGTPTFLGSDGGNEAYVFMRRLTVWNSRLDDVTLKGFTYP